MKNKRPFGVTDMAHPGGKGSSLSSRLVLLLLSNVSVLCNKCGVQNNVSI